MNLLNINLEAPMLRRNLFCFLFLANFIAGNTVAATVYPGSGIGYAAKLIFDKSDTTKNAQASFLTSGESFNTPNDNGTPSVIPTTTSTSWCDSVANAQVNALAGSCYGSATEARWFLLDFSKLKSQGVSKITVAITAKRAEGSDLIPAITVWGGNQTLGPQIGWFPSELQQQPSFWGWQLKPNPLTKSNKPSSYDTAYGTSTQDVAAISGTLALKGSSKDMLTVVVGGDARSDDPGQKHNAGFQLKVRIKQVSSGLDPNGCVVGKTCYHPQMDHCMSVDLCNQPKYQGQCICY